MKVKELSGRRDGPVLSIRGRTLGFEVPRVMGIVNVTPDSFSGDGIHDDIAGAVSNGLAMFRAGADFVDVGGESTRPGAAPVSAEEEIRRTVPVVSELVSHGAGEISIDTMKPSVARAAIEAGASMVNDVSGLRDHEMIQTVSEGGASVIIMHMQGLPATMQDSPTYSDVVTEIIEFLNGRISEAERGGVPGDKMMIDPGIGFGKSLDHNLDILARLREFRTLGKPIVVGVSRKSFIGKMTGAQTDERLGGSLSAALMSTLNGADVVRTHDVFETCQALRVAHAITGRIGLPSDEL